MRALMVRAFAVVLTVLTTVGVVGGAPASAAQDAPGVTGLSSYESPTFGYEVGWAGAIGLWEVVPEATVTGDGLDLLTLVSPFLARVQIFGVDPGPGPRQPGRRHARRPPRRRGRRRSGRRGGCGRGNGGTRWVGSEALPAARSAAGSAGHPARSR